MSRKDVSIRAKEILKILLSLAIRTKASGFRTNTTGAQIEIPLLLLSLFCVALLLWVCCTTAGLRLIFCGVWLWVGLIDGGSGGLQWLI